MLSFRKPLLRVVLVIAPLVVGAFAAQAETWGSISVDFPGEGHSMANPAYGIGGGDSKAEAIANAQKFCGESGGKACKTAVSYAKCGAYAAADAHGGTGFADTKKIAEANAIAGCAQDACKILVSDCN
jgi:hypothetical protein